jgi:hypothetical protein
LLNKEILEKQARDVNALLGEYVEVHNLRLKKGGTLSSLLKNLFINKKVGFEEIYGSAKTIFDKLEDKHQELFSIKKASYANFHTEEGQFYDCLIKYEEALTKCASKLCDLTGAQFFLSQSKKKHNLTWEENQKLEKDYQESINNYVVIGEDLNTLYNRLQTSAAIDELLIEKEPDESKHQKIIDDSYFKIKAT